MDVRLTPEAMTDLLRLETFLLELAPAATDRAADRIADALERLSETPRLGRPVTNDLRELVVPFGGSAYVLLYRVDAEAVVVARVWHGREARR